MVSRVNDSLYLLAEQRGHHIEQVSREAWKYPGLSWELPPGLRVRLASGLIVLAERLAPEVARTTSVAAPARG